MVNRFRSVFSILGVIGLGACGQGSESSGEPTDGACEGASCSCAAPLVDCGGICVDRLVDGANCGACANVCGSGLVCSQGTCAASCDATETWCGSRCVDVLSHPAHCGACDVLCNAGSECAAGVCQVVSGGTGGTSSGGGSAMMGGATGGGMSTGGIGTGGLDGNASGGSGGGASGGSGPLEPCDPYVWPSYEPHLDYELPGSNIDPSSLSIYPGCSSSETAGTMSDGWWSITWGDDLNPQVTEQQMAQVLAGLNEDMGYVRDIMGWPPDPMPQAGYFSSVYVYGSGLCTDNADNQAQGGWQSNIGPYPMLLLSWAPIVNYDRGGITHEAIHAMVKGMPGGNNKAHWFNEGGNTWIQMQFGAEKDGTYGVGFLDGAPFVAPHQPIESYSGWLLDGSFGGPDAEGVGQPDCNWRRYLGGTQYNSILSHFLSLHVSEGANVWLGAQQNPRNILETLATGLGEEQTRHLVMEYRARTALVDFGPWRDSIISQGINYTWGDNLNRECGSGENPPRLPFDDLRSHDDRRFDYRPRRLYPSRVVRLQSDPAQRPRRRGASEFQPGGRRHADANRVLGR